MNLAQQILDLFRGRPDILAVADDKGFHPQTLETPIKPSWIRKEHLGGNRCLGFYLMDEQSCVCCSAVDFDNKPDNPDPEWQEKAEGVYYELTQLGLVPIVEISQSGHAAHVWLFFDEPVDAWLVRQFWAAIEESSNVDFVEVYPRQDALAGKKLGNLIRYPLWNESRFVDVEYEWVEIDAAEAMAGARKTEAATLRMLIYQLTGKSPAKPEKGVADSGLSARVDRLVSRPNTLLNRRWHGDMSDLNDRSRSALVLSIATELVRLYVPTPEVEHAIQLWCEQNDYSKGEREDWIATTVGKAYEFIGDREGERKSTSIDMRDAVMSYIDMLERGIPPSIGSGIGELDKSIDGIAPGEMCVIAARPSHGKTAFALQWVHEAAFHGKACLIISEEMGEHEIAKRAMLSMSQLAEYEWAKNISELKIDTAEHYDSRANIKLAVSCQTIDEVERQIDEHCALNSVQLVAVDYLQLLSSEKSNRYEVVTDISRRLKQSAAKNKVAMIVLCQLNREVEKRGGQVPRLSDLRESGQIEQDADLVLFLQWPHKMHADNPPEDYLVWCSKRRNGPIREQKVDTKFDAVRQRFGVPELATAWTPEAGEYEERFPYK